MLAKTAFSVLIASILALPAEAKPVKADALSASSSYPDEEGVSYDVKHIGDRKQSTVWVEGEKGSGLGSWVQMDFNEAKTLSGLRIWNGNWFSADFWTRHNRMKDIEIEFSDGTKIEMTLKDEMKPEDVRFPKAVTTTSVKIRFKTVYSGSTFNDTCISEIQLLDGAPDDFITPSSYKASSVYPSDADGNYDPMNLADGLMDSMWCEGSKDGDGVGEWLEFNFDGPRSVSKLRLNNGNAFSLSDNAKANRATTGTLSFDDGSTQEVKFKPMMTTQTVEFTAKTTSKVRLTFTAVARGSEYNDLCISEAAFQE